MKINSKWPAIVGICGSLIFGATGWAETVKAPTTTTAATLAVIGEKSITVDHFRAEMARQRGTFDAERKEELLDNIVRSELIFAAARSAGYESDPVVIAAVKQAMVGKYMRDNLEPKMAKLTATDQEAEAYYNSHQAEFGAAAMIHVAMIKIAVSPKYSAEKKGELLKRAVQARGEALLLKAPAFGAVAVNYSDDQDNRYRGGDIGWLQAGAEGSRFDKKVSAAIAALRKAGEISPVITAPDGYYLVKLIEAKEASVKPFAAVKDGVRYQVVQEKKQQLEQEFIEQLKGKIPVTVNSSLLQTIAMPAAEKQAGPPALPVR